MNHVYVYKNYEYMRLPIGSTINGWMPWRNFIPIYYPRTPVVVDSGIRFFRTFGIGVPGEIRMMDTRSGYSVTGGYLYYQERCIAAAMFNIIHGQASIEPYGAYNMKVFYDPAWMSVWVDWNMPLSNTTRSFARLLNAQGIHTMEFKDLHHMLFPGIQLPRRGSVTNFVHKKVEEICGAPMSVEPKRNLRQMVG